MIISGLKPETIIEICGRGLSFWVYQVYQEQCYQELLVRNLDDRKHTSERQFHSVIMQSKAELNGSIIFVAIFSF
jgi:E3 ubiquitin-protein ligase CCNP1IP1